ncbi:MAG: glycosyltransferase [Planctomycetes bacterium]|nr:glycosyltransferase [Planctomycetota bacterium]
MAPRALRFLFARRGESLGTLVGLFWRSLRAEGLGPTWRRLRSYVGTVAAAAETPLPPRSTQKDVLWVAGCPGHPRRWRCEHALERLQLAGGSGDVVDWPAVPLADYLDCYRTFVLQRVPHEPSVAAFVAAARAAGKRVVVDVDDLVIHERYGPELPILAGYGELGRELYVQQLRRIGQVLALVEAAQAATATLARELQRCFPHLQVEVVRNVASRAMVERSAAALGVAADRAEDGTVTLGYFAGTRTHDADLGTIADALAAVLAARPAARLLLVGEVEPPAALRPFAARIERRPPVPWPELPALLRRADVHLVPLTDTLFTACKSELKWVEAALVGRPVVAAAVGPYRDCVRPGQNGWLAADAAAFAAALLAAIDDPAARVRLGAAARAEVLAQWTTAAGAARPQTSA